MFFCITFGIGPFKQRSKNSVWTCPNCSARDVYLVRSQDCFEICFIPLIPCGSKKQLYECSTCGWVNVYQPPF